MSLELPGSTKVWLCPCRPDCYRFLIKFSSNGQQTVVTFRNKKAPNPDSTAFDIFTSNGDWYGGNAKVMAKLNNLGLEHSVAKLPLGSGMSSAVLALDCKEASSGVASLTLWSKPVRCLGETGLNEPVLKMHEFVWHDRVVPVKVTSKEHWYSGICAASE